jgi:ubiquinone biosynthesis protein
MMWETLGTVRDLGRLQEIAVVLIRYGFGDVVRRIGLASTLERAGRLLHWNEERQELLRMTAPVRVRSAMQDLGPTFVKLGQVLATRVDLLPPEWIAELSELQNAVPALPYADIREQLEADLGAACEVFAFLDETPMAAASLAQAHRARLHDGREVVLKVRRPGIRDVVEADLRLLARWPRSSRRAAGPAPLSPGRGRAAVHRIAAPRAGFRRRMPQCRAHRAQLQRPRRHTDSRRCTGSGPARA